ncbi:MAG: hypothetical protein M1570_00360 [Chloroflexi bacterium]|nr:hypothetical protein [Chloroflexota bacterium]
MYRPQRAGKPLPYSEILRVVGAYADRAFLAKVRVLETDEGLILQGELTRGDRTGELETYQLTTEDIDTLVWDAFALRGTKI